MNKIKRLLRQPEFQLFLCCLFFLLINWPFLFVSASRGLMSIFTYLFILWAFFIVILFLIQRSLQDGSARRDEQGRS